MNEEYSPQIGDIVYLIVATNTRSFFRACRVCNGERQLTVNGVTFTCPVCNREEALLSVCGYKVVKCKVYSITKSVNTDCWQLPTDADGNYICKLEYKLFNKRGKGYNDGNYTYYTRASSAVTTYLNHNKPDDYATLENFARNPIEKYLYAVYTDYKLAVSLADRFSQLQAERVRRYNEENGTSFDVPCLCQLHDKKG